ATLSGGVNDLRVVAWNAEGYLSSRGLRATWSARPAADEHPAELYAIVAGVSDYAAPELRLNFAAKDAEDIARALALAGERLFGAGRVHLTVLTTSGAPGTLPATKANLRAAFEAARAARPG